MMRCEGLETTVHMLRGALLRCLALALLADPVGGLSATGSGPIEVGVAVRDITPELPIWLAGYASRKRPADKVDHPLLAQALVFRSPGGERFVFVTLDNCEVNRAFNAPVLQELEQKHGLKRGTVLIAGTHTHSAPVLEKSLEGMYPLGEADKAQIERYSRKLQGKLVEVVGAALADCKAAVIEHGVGRATFAMNRRIYADDQVAFGENLDGPVDWDVPVLRIKDSPTNSTPRVVLFGYACHGTSIQGEDFYIVSGDYMAYARNHLESMYPGAVAIYLPGMGADSNPSPRSTLLDSKRHGIELAGAVLGVLNRPMQPVKGPMKWAYQEVELPLEQAPARDQIEKDAQSKDIYIQNRARGYLEAIASGRPLPSVQLPISAVRLGDDLTFITMGGEVVVDYAVRFKRMFAADHPWLIGYAYEVPCYIPSVRILKEGGYEAMSSLIYYGLYGPIKPQVEGLLLRKMTDMVASLKTH